MRITKYSHSCLLVEINSVCIVTDPGIWNSLPDAKYIDAILITHEHQDHCDIEQIKALVARCPSARVITQEAVAKKLKEVGVTCETIKNGTTIDIKGISVESYGSEHACIYGDVSPCQNTGYLINGELFAPGDALHDLPARPVRILALPTGGPWMRLSEAIDYAKKLKPEIVFPIHDAMYIEKYRKSLIPRIVGGNLESVGIKFIDIPLNSPQEF